MTAVKLLKRQPWRFKPGEQVYVQGWEADTTGLVVEQLRDGLAFPHYLVVDPDGQVVGHRPAPPVLTTHHPI